MKKLFGLALMAGVAGVAISSTPVQAKDLGDSYLSKERFQIRGRIISVGADGDGIVEGPALNTDVEHAVTPEVDLTYFFTENIAAELIAATSEHRITAGSSTIGDAWILPPTVTLQYHFSPDAKFSPYVGAGINYSLFYGEDAVGIYSNLDVDGGFGLAAQAGFDYWINDNWGLNFDVKYIDLQVDVQVNNGNPTDLYANNVDLDPWIIGTGVSYRF